ncbi:peroxidase 11 [Solanum stenotomum]|uniref:peroxidase 11 n=1 Tax=Solanum stenotomum TaxID=172797 RepID=UPI0020D16C67|nr:peroxidase 11 [Solanum stenotomum]
MAFINFYQSRIVIFEFLVLVFIGICFSKLNGISDSHLSLDYYKKTCPSVEGIVRKEMECACLSDPRNAALILRLHFHDCFVQGCDGSVLLDDTVTLKGEKNAPNNKNALKGFKIIDRIKNRIESECPGTVSCADILTIAARDAVLLVGGPYWDVPLGRKDSIKAGYELADTNLPTADEGLISIISKFISQGLSVTDMVALSGAHTIGKARCVNFRNRIYGDFKMTSTSYINPISSSYLSKLKSLCPPIEINGSSDNNETSMDNVTPNLFDNSYYHVLLKGEGLINSDQELYSSFLGVQTKKIVEKYAANTIAFFEQFAESMVKMGNITNKETYVNGEVRKSCRFVNT